MTGHRRAALAIHGLAPEDREWILAELPAGDRDALVRYLGELKELGFPGGVSSYAGRQYGVRQSPLLPQSAEIRRLDAAGAQEMFTLLVDEPASLIGTLLAIHDWSWTEAFLNMLSPIRRNRVEAVRSSCKVPPALKECLLKESVAQLKKSRGGQLLRFDRHVSLPARRLAARAAHPLARLAGLWKR